MRKAMQSKAGANDQYHQLIHTSYKLPSAWKYVLFLTASSGLIRETGGKSFEAQN